MEPIDWPAAAAETIRHLQALLRLDTTNPPGRELIAAEYLAAVLQGEGIEPRVFESTPGRASVIARLRGSGQAPPLLLYSHTDVVPAEPAYWTHPPFAGDIADGYVWGRGAVDMKNTVAQQLMVLLTLKRQGTPLRRDVIFAATADEEVGGPNGFGMSWLVLHHPDLLRAEFALSEVGGYNIEFAGRRVYLIQVAEKGVCWVKVRAHGRPGHAAQPHRDNAVLHLARGLTHLAANGLPYHLTPAAAAFLDAGSRAAGAGSATSQLLRGLKDRVEAERAFQVELQGHELYPAFYAMLHNTATPTGLTAGYKTNVIPAEAEAVIDCRILPGFNSEALLDELRPALDEKFDYEVMLEAPPLETSADTPLFKLMADTITAHDPQAAAVLPYMLPAATDAKYLAPMGVPTYGFAPLQLPSGMPLLDMFHAHDERVPVDGLGWGVRVLYDVVQAYCA